MGKGILAFIVIFLLLITFGFYFRLPLFPLLLLGSVLACVISFVVFGMLGNETEKKQEKIIEEEKRYFKGTNKNNS